MANQFELNTNDVLGFDYEMYVSSIRALALSQPAKYFELRRQVLKTVKKDAVGSLYKTFFNVLSKGQDINGKEIGLLGSSEAYTPSYPSQKINSFALEVSSDLADHINRVIDIILPDDFEKIASAKLTLKGRGTNIDLP